MTINPNNYDDVQSVVSEVRALIPPKYQQIAFAVVCGIGFEGLADSLQDAQEVLYSQVHGFVTSHKRGCIGKLMFGTIGGKVVMMILGRSNGFEVSGQSLATTALPVRVAALMGANTIMMCCVAGAINNKNKVGGPQFETPSEVQFMAAAGADVIGMSLCHEVLVARHSSARVLALACVTNVCEKREDAPQQAELSEQLSNEAATGTRKIAPLLRAFVESM